jgi:hypothetical protein
MSVPTNPPPAPARTSVFVDESGRRRARTRVFARALVGAAGIYVLVVIAGLTSAVSLPGVHLGVLARAAPGREHAGPLGSRSKVLSLPAALKPRPHARAAGQLTPRAAPRTAGTAPGGAIRGTDTTGSAPGTDNAATTTRPSSPTSTTLPVTTTTKHRGQPTSTSHGPPSTKPGVGKGRNAP